MVILSISGVQSHLYTCTCAVLLSRLLSLYMYHHYAYNTTFCSRTYTCTYMVILITSNVMYIVTSSSCRRPNLHTRHPDPVNCHLPDICGLAEHRVDSPVAATVSLCGQTHSRLHLCHVLGSAGVFTCIQYTCTCSVCAHVGPAGVFMHVYTLYMYSVCTHVGLGGVCVRACTCIQ